MSEKKLYIATMGEEAYKIGVSKDPQNRRNQLATGNPKEIEIESVYGALSDANKDVEEIERSVHDYLGDHSMSGEWFEYESLPIAKAYLDGVYHNPQGVDIDFELLRDMLRKHFPSGVVEYNFATETVKDYFPFGTMIKGTFEEFGNNIVVCSACERIFQRANVEPGRCPRCNAKDFP